MYPPLKSRSRKAGLPPGVLMPSDTKGGTVVTWVNYDQEKFTEKVYSVLPESFPIDKSSGINWIHVQGIAHSEIIESLGSQFKLHRLITEDIATPGQRPKVEEYDRYVFLIIRSLDYYEDHGGHVEDEQISIVLFDNLILSFQEKNNTLFDSVRERLRLKRGNMRKLSADYLAYALIDMIVDNYFILLDKIGGNLEKMEEHLTSYPKEHLVEDIHNLRREMIFIRRSIWPLREVISRLLRQESNHFSKATLFYLRDVYDHAIQVIDAIEMFRDLIAGMLDLYRSSVTQRLNEVIKILTIVSTVFCPLTFLTGLFGMNFSYMPGLQWQYGFFVAIGIMIIVALCMLGYIKHKKWL
ncbi:MAG: magnesium/cobalt transporter CorA [Parachlamydiales bacterium]|nr:magnesium/cobalt transporter CorA [Parachlamydiales bacterium]